MENDVLLLVILVFIIFGIFMYILDKENTAKINKKLYGKLEDYPKEDLSFREVQEKREENFKQALREHGMPVLGDEKEEELVTKVDKNDMLNIFIKLVLGSFAIITFFILFSESLESDKTIILGGVNTNIPIYIIIASIPIVGFLIYLNYKLENLILDLLKLIFIFLLRIALFCLFLFCLYSVIANIIHFNIFMAILWTLGAIVSFFIFMFSIQ